MKNKPMEIEIELEKKGKEDDDFEADHAVEHLTKAHEMMANPELMKRVHAKAGRKMKALKGLFGKPKMKSVQDIRDYKNKKAVMKKDEEME